MPPSTPPLRPAQPAGWALPASRTLVDALGAVGTGNFGHRLLNHLQEACGADHCAVFRIGSQAPTELATGSYDGSATAHARVRAYLERQLWSEDPAMVHAHSGMDPNQLLLMRVDVSNVADADVRDVVWPRIQDRLVVAGRNGRAAYSMSILREGARGFTTVEVERLGESAGVLLALLAKHADLAEPRQAPDPLASLPAIEACLAELSPLTPRELEVCARILYGMSGVGISLDLGIGAETVKTFRKLAYRRLAIGSERELLSYYLGLQQRWSELQEGGSPTSRPR